MACNLARSFLWWHKHSKIDFYLATDIQEKLTKDLQGIKLITIQKGMYGSGFSPKLHMDRFSPAKETLFIDADCLCAGNLEHVFEKFSKWDVSVIGREETEGELFGDIQSRCKKTGVSWVPRFCGGMYYFKEGAISKQVFEKARELEKRYDELGLTRLRGVANEEPLIGIAMSMAGQHPIPEDGTIKAEPMFFSSRTELDVFAGKARLFNKPDQPKLKPEWSIPEEARPAVVHFNCTYAEQPPYTAESFRLRKVLLERWPLAMATLYANLFYTTPFLILEKVKANLRPLYRRVFGIRKVKPNLRIS
jgi:hypothetical protein